MTSLIYWVEKYSAVKATCLHGGHGIEKNLFCFITPYCITQDPWEFDTISKCRNECRNVSTDVRIVHCFVFLLFSNIFHLTTPLSCQERKTNRFCVYVQYSPICYKAALSFHGVLYTSSTELCGSCGDTKVVINNSPKPGFKIPNRWSRSYCIYQCISRL